MKNESSVILIGMPGSGKSTAGVLLAKWLGYGFVDTDLLVQQQAGKQLPQLIAEQGIAGFLHTEESVICQFVGQMEMHFRMVIATGGSVIYEKKAMQQLSRIGTIVYLQADFKILQKRISDLRSRGVVLPPGMSFEQLFDDRTPLHEQYADITICEKDNNLEEVVLQLAECLERRAQADG